MPSTFIKGLYRSTKDPVFQCKGFLELVGTAEYLLRKLKSLCDKDFCVQYLK